MGDKPEEKKPADKPTDKKADKKVNYDPVLEKNRPAPENLTDDQKKERNEKAKTIANGLLSIKAWDWDEHRNNVALFTNYGPKDTVKILRFNGVKKEFFPKEDPNSYYTISGSEYRYAMALSFGLGSIRKLDPVPQKMLSKEIFGQETVPSEESDEYLAGCVKAVKLRYILHGESAARRAAEDLKTEALKKEGTEKKEGAEKPPIIGENPPVGDKPPVPVEKPPIFEKSGDMSMFNDETLDKLVAEVERATAARNSKMRADLGLPDHIGDALSSANLQVSGVSMNTPAPKLAFKTAKVEKTKEPSLVA